MNIRHSDHRNAHAPDGLRLYAVGDIHGRLDLLDALLELIVSDNAGREPKETVVVFAGDYTDRGPDSKGVVDRLIRGLPPGLSPIFLKGNHESFLLSFLQQPASGLNWLYNGGVATLLSYGLQKELVTKALLIGGSRLTEASERFQARLPESHLQFFEELELYHRFGDYFFVHAGVRPGVGLEDQNEEDLLWIRDEFLNWPHDFGAVVVHGHTPVHTPEDYHNRIGIDTYAFQTGKLTAVGLEGPHRWFLSTNASV
ncbi:MAG: metallophosphoesterase [Rhodomicrobium sp.]